MEGHSEAAARGAGDHGAGPAIGVPTEKYSGESDSGAVGATQQLKRRASGEPETAASDFSELSKAKITEAFQAATREVAALKKRGAPPTEVQPVIERLQALKRQHARLARRKKGDPRKGRAPPLDRTAAHRCYPPFTAVPTDPADPEFTRSFSTSDEREAAKEFFDQYGFVVFRNVIDQEQCRATVGEIFEHLSTVHPGFVRGNPDTHRLVSSETYGLPSQQAFFTRRCLENRQSPGVLAALRTVLGRDGILVSHDRWCVYRPTLEHPEWRTRGNVHLDVHPWRYTAGDTAVEKLDYTDPVDFITELNSVIQATGPHVQGVLSLEDNREADGGTVLVPKFHTVFSEWFRQLGPLERNADVSGLCWVVNRRQGGGSFKFAPEDPIYGLSHRITMRAGSFVLWNQELVHGSRPNTSNQWRVAQFIKAFPSTAISDERAAHRRTAVARGIAEAGTAECVSDAGLRVFGLESRDLTHPP